MNVLIIGGGASGMAAALTAARRYLTCPARRPPEGTD